MNEAPIQRTQFYFYFYYMMINKMDNQSEFKETCPEFSPTTRASALKIIEKFATNSNKKRLSPLGAKENGCNDAMLDETYDYLNGKNTYAKEHITDELGIVYEPPSRQQSKALASLYFDLRQRLDRESQQREKLVEFVLNVKKEIYDALKIHKRECYNQYKEKISKYPTVVEIEKKAPKITFAKKAIVQACRNEAIELNLRHMEATIGEVFVQQKMVQDAVTALAEQFPRICESTATAIGMKADKSELVKLHPVLDTNKKVLQGIDTRLNFLEEEVQNCSRVPKDKTRYPINSGKGTGGVWGEEFKSGPKDEEASVTDKTVEARLAEIQSKLNYLCKERARSATERRQP